MQMQQDLHYLIIMQGFITAFHSLTHGAGTLRAEPHQVPERLNHSYTGKTQTRGKDVAAIAIFGLFTQLSDIFIQYLAYINKYFHPPYPK